MLLAVSTLTSRTLALCKELDGQGLVQMMRFSCSIVMVTESLTTVPNFLGITRLSLNLPLVYGGMGSERLLSSTSLRTAATATM